MFCDRCGTNLPQTARFCSSCGRSFAPPMPPVVTRPRVASNIRNLGILWIVYSILHLLPALFIGSFFRWFGFPHDAPFLLLHGVLGALSTLFLAKGVLGIIAGWGLLERQGWARMLALVLGFISLIHMPFGTAIGIYTLWVLLPGTSEMEYRQIARS